MNVSQNTIRDALYMLEQQGLVVKHARRGVYVRAYSAAEAEEVYALWGAIEGMVLAWVLPRLEREAHKRLADLIDEARRRVRVGDLAVEGVLLAFHQVIASHIDRPQTANLLASLHNQLHLLERIREMRAPRNTALREAQLEAYTRLLQAIRQGDVPTAQAHLHDYIRVECDSLLPLLDA